MLIISLSYTAPLDQVDRHLDAHVAWLKEGYASGMFVASGRKVPRRGGIILAQGEREGVEAMAERDPFVTEGVATCEITEFTVTMTGEGLGTLRDR